jgi:hypothetical protein
MLTLNYNIDSLLVRNPLLMASFPKRSTLTTAYGIIEDGKLDVLHLLDLNYINSDNRQVQESE